MGRKEHWGGLTLELVDAAMARVGIPASRTDMPEPGGAEGNLEAPRTDTDRTEGYLGPRARRFSLYTWLETHPPAKALAAPLLVWFRMAAMLALIVLVATSVWRRPFRLSYEAWHAIHAVLAVVLVVAGGALIAGIPGALFAVPLAAFVNVVAVYLSRRSWQTGESPSTDLIWNTVPRPRPRRARA